MAPRAQNRERDDGKGDDDCNRLDRSGQWCAEREVRSEGEHEERDHAELPQREPKQGTIACGLSLRTSRNH